PEHISIVVTDRIRSADPWFILTGHTLMVGDLGRSLSGKPASTMGFERRNNRAFGIEDETEFLRMMAAGIPQPLPGASQIRAVNAGYPVSVQ
ncbi:MAG: MBL fold metallo-hydrolase, partial [Pseudomonadota bacterium]